MPKQYEAIRDKLATQGVDYDEAQSRAAAIYNAKHPSRPVTGRTERVKVHSHQPTGFRRRLK